MALRISLILAILAGLGVIGVSQFMLRPQIEGIREKRDYNEKEWKKTDTELRKTKKTLKETSEKLTKTESILEETKGQLTAVTAKFEAEQKRAADLQVSIDKLRTELKSAMDHLAAWTNLGLHVDQVKGVISEANTLRKENDGLKEESKVLLVKVKKLDAEVKRLTGPTDDDPPLPRDVRGKVLVVDPKWNFLVLDVGTKVGVVQRGVLLVSRNGELIAKVRVMNTEDQRSIANIMPGWKLKDVMEGDVVLPY